MNLTPHLRASVRLTLGIAVIASACSDDTAPTAASAALRLQSEPAQFADFAPIAGSAACVAPPTTAAGFATYQPFVLPPGYTQTILATELNDFAPVAGTSGDNPDMLTLNEGGPQAGRFIYRTHEVGSNGAVTKTDMVTGVTTLVDKQSHYEALDGVVWTPWNTLLFAEERIVASFRDPRVPNAVGGLVYEYDPSTGIIVPRPAVGARSHEGLRFDVQGNLYGISESTPNSTGSGAVYKFVPDRKGDLSSGQLYALKVASPSRTGPAVWVALDRALVQDNSDAAAIAVGATGWGRPEDIEIRNHAMFITATSEALVLRIELDGNKAFVSNFVKEGVNVTGLQNPDNLAIDKQGNVYIIEDNGPGDIFVARTNHASDRVATQVDLFTSLSDCSAEPTGFYFDRTGKLAWVHVQHAGGALRNDLMVSIAKN